MELTDFKHVKSVHVRYDDLDTFGHVNNKAYLAYLEEARIDFHKSLFEWKGVLEFNAIVAHIEINYILPVLYGDNLSLNTRVSNIGTKSFELESIFLVKREEKVINVANAKVVLVAIDPSTGKTRPIPADEKSKLIEYQSI